VLTDSFSTVPKASVPVFIFCAPVGVGSRFHILPAQTRFRRYRVRRVSFSYFARPDSFSLVPRASRPIFMFCAPGLIFGSRFHILPAVLIFGGDEYIGSHFHVLFSRTHFRRCGARQVPFSCFARPDSFSTVPRASRPFFLFCAPGLHFGGIEGVGSLFHVWRSRTHFRRYGGR
jgi:hypothetical protein